ncbi:MAG: hypothetical protein QXE76_02915 [Candidatus Bathyarchaeia archaeon]
MANTKLTTKDIALIVSFAPCYTILSFLPSFPIIGGVGKSITAAVMISPVIGLLLNPSLSILTIAIGGSVAFFMGAPGPFGPLSFLPHAATAFCASLLSNDKRNICLLTYISLLLAFAFYPVIGPVWSWPLMVWMHLVGLVLLASPLLEKAIKILHEFKSSSEFVLSLFAIIFVAALYGHLAGSILFEIFYRLAFPGVEDWKNLWFALTFVYPLERIIITGAATLIAAGIMKALKTQLQNTLGGSG